MSEIFATPPVSLFGIWQIPGSAVYSSNVFQMYARAGPECRGCHGGAPTRGRNSPMGAQPCPTHATSDARL